MQLIRVLENQLTPTPDHTGVDSRVIANKSFGTQYCEAKLGYYQPGGKSIFHTHPDFEHIFFILEGQLTTINENGDEITAFANEAIVVPAKETHMAINRGETVTTYIAINAPSV